MRSYIKEVILRAWQDTLSDFQFNNFRQVVVKAILAVIVLWLLASFGWHEIWVGHVGGFATAIIAIVLFFPLVLILNLIIAPVHVDAEKTEKISRLEGQLSSKEAQRKVVDGLAASLSEAIHNLYNRAIHNEEEMTKWQFDYETWCREIGDTLEREFSLSRRLHFDRIGSVPAVDHIGHYNSRHNQLLSHLDIKFERLRDIIKSTWIEQ